MTHSDLIEAKGPKTIAEKLRVPQGHVRVWKSRGIPKARYAEIIDAFGDVTLEMLRRGAPS